MIELLTNKVLKYLVKYDEVSSCNIEKYNWIKYGIELLISTIIGIVNIIILSLLLGNFLGGLIFIAVFVPLRQYLGGYHADTYLKCNLTLLLCCSLYLILLYLFPTINNIINIVICAVELVLIVCWFPVENKHKPFKNKQHYLKCKVKSVIAFSIYSLIGLFLGTKSIRCGTMMLYSIHIVIILGIIGFFKERRNKNEEMEI